jgi:hypothetical protein
MSLLSKLITNYGDDAARSVLSVFKKPTLKKVEREALEYFTKRKGKGGLDRALINDGIMKASLWRRTPKFVKYGLGLPAALAAGTAVYSKLSGPPTADSDYSNWKLTPYGMPGESTGSSVLDDYLNKQRAEVERYYNSINTTVPGAEIYDPMSKISAQLGAASSQSMADLANSYANTAASIKQGGVQGAASINDIYGAGAANMENVASQAGGQYSGMIPVAGAEALAPGQQIAAGQDLANYLAQNQLISAQTQGGMAALAQMLGPAYANQYALIDAQMRAQAQAQKAIKEAELRQALEMEKAGALADITRMGIEQGYQDSLANQGLAEAIQLLATPETLNTLASEYEDLEDRDKAFYANNYGIDSPEAYVRFKLTSMAKQYGQG